MGGMCFVSILLIMSSFFLRVFKDDDYSWLTLLLNAKAPSPSVAFLKILHWVLFTQFLIISIYICFYIFCISLSCSKGVFPSCWSEKLLFEGKGSPGNPPICCLCPGQRDDYLVLPVKIKPTPFRSRSIYDVKIMSSKNISVSFQQVALNFVYSFMLCY